MVNGITRGERNLRELTAPSKSEAQLQCEANGGKWDGNKCIMPEVTPEVTPEPDLTKKTEANPFPFGTPEPEKKEAPPVFRDEFGRLSGFTTPEGETFLGANPEEVTEAVTSESFKQELPIGGQAEGVLERQRQGLQETGVGLAADVGASPSDEILAQLQSEVVADGLNYFSAFKSAAPGAIPDILTGASAGAGVGALGGSVVLPGVGTVTGAGGLAIVGAVTGGVKGFYSDFIRDLSSQQSAQIEGTIRTLSETKPTLNDIVNSQNANPENANENKKAFDNQMAFIDLAYEDLKDLTDSNLNDFLGDNGIKQLKEFEVFYELDGERDRLEFDMKLALANPDPARIRPTAITIKDIEKRIQQELKQ